MSSARSVRFIRLLLLALIMLFVPAASFAQLGISILIAPPVLPVYEQPVCPGGGYIWTPGYWAWADGDYYWVPGTWVLAPEVGLLWTPGYWAWGGTSFVFYPGYWGPQVGFYGGINYGYGYFGHGYAGGRWDNGQFYYNRAVANVNVAEIHNVYSSAVVGNTTTRVSYNGGNGGISARPTAEEESAENARHIPPLAVQTQHAQAALANQDMRALANHGKPPIAATPTPGAFNDRGVIPAREGSYSPPARSDSSVVHTNTPIHPDELAPITAPTVNTGNLQLDKKYQQQQEKLAAQQEQERQELQLKQEQDHQQLAQEKADLARNQQLEQQHQHQTQQLAQKHAQQQQKLQEHQQSSH